MKKWSFALSCMMFFSASATAFAQEITRTDWQMHEGKGPQDLKVQPSGDSAVAIYALAEVPSALDKDWKAAPDGNIINFGDNSSSKIEASKCRKQVDYTYFQTFVTVPENVAVNEFKIEFKDMDDGSRVSVYNADMPKGQIVPGSYVKKGQTGIADLKGLLKPGLNRVVITQVDDCAVGNKLKSAQVRMNGQVIQPAAKATRTEWEMHEGQPVIELDKAHNHPKTGDKTAFERAVIPADNDKGWGPAPDGQIINFARPSVIPSNKCRSAVDYTYFQTFAMVPNGVKVKDFKISMNGMDDGAYITIFNSANPQGKIIEGSYVTVDKQNTSDLSSLLTTGMNRVVITQVDDCAVLNNLKRADVVFDGLVIPAPK